MHDVITFINFVEMDTKKFTNILARRLERDPGEVEVSVKALSRLIADQIVEGNSVSVPSFGSFEPKMRSERETTHPSTGKKILVPPKLSMVFRPSALLKQKVRKIED